MTRQIHRRLFLRTSLIFSASGGIAWTLTRGLRPLSASEPVITPAIGIAAERTREFPGLPPGTMVTYDAAGRVIRMCIPRRYSKTFSYSYKERRAESGEWRARA